MFLWCLLLVILALFSYFTDMGKLPFETFRHLLNFMVLGLGVYLIVRTRLKQRVGYIETLESRVGELASRYEGLKFNKFTSKLDEMEKRIAQLEGKIKGE